MNGNKIISIEFPSEILLALNLDESELKKDIRITLAVKFYQLQKLTIGKAAQLAGLSRLEFENFLAQNKIPVSNLDIDDINNDIKKLS